MAKQVDERVVEMRFENSQFEQGAKNSLSTLDRLKKAFDFSGSSKGIAELEKTFKGFNLYSLAEGVENLSTRFSTMGILGVTALQDISRSAIATGKQLVSAFTIDPVKTGLQEYETQINAVQTILANTKSKGSTLDDVNRALDELNHYADMTIYNFTEMTRNIGTFTAAGVELDTSVQAIKGIANLAAVSGSTSQQASTAMYQLSQALAAGTVKLQDWNSVVNAGMGGQVFQDALKETARVHGIAIDQMIAEEGSFRETLSEGWLSASILTETLAKFTGDLSEEELRAIGYTNEQIAAIMEMGETANDAATKVKTFTQLLDTLKEAAQSGWTQSWETIIGDFEEAKEFLTTLSNIFSGLIEASSTVRNNTLEGWAELGGRKDLIQSIYNIIDAIISLIAPIKNAWDDIFPPMTAERLYEATKKLQEFTYGLLVSQEHAEKFERTFKGVFAILDIFRKTISDIVGGAFKVFAALIGAVGDDVLSLTSSIGDGIVSFRDWYVQIDVISKIFDYLAEGIKNAKSWIDKIAKSEQAIAIFNRLSNSLQETKNRINDLVHSEKLSSALTKSLEVSKKGFSELQTIYKGLSEVFSGFINRTKQLDGLTLDNVKKAFIDLVTSIRDYFSGYTMSLDNMEKEITVVKDAWNVGLNSVGINLDKLKDKFESFLSFIKSGFDRINFGALFSVSLGAGLIYSLDQLAKAVSSFNVIPKAIAGVLGSVKDAIQAYQKELNSKALVNNAKAIAILAGALTVLALVGFDRLQAVIPILGEIAVGLVAFSFAMSKISGSLKDTTKVALGLISFSASLLVLVQALKSLETVKMEDIEKRGLILAALAAGLTAAGIALGKLAPSLSSSAAFFISFAASIKILISALEDLEAVEADKLEDKIGVLVKVMAALALLAKLATKTKISSAAGKGSQGVDAFGILSVVVALKVVISALDDISKINMSEIENNMSSFILVFGTFGALMLASSVAGKHAAKAGVALLLMSESLQIIVSAFKKMAQLNSRDLDLAQDVVAKILLIFGAITALTNFAGANASKAGVAMLTMSAAIDLLVPAIWALSEMDPEGVKRGVDAVSQLEIMFGIVIAATKLAGDAVNTIKTITLCSALLAAVVAGLSFVDPTGLTNATIAIDSIMGMMALVVASTHIAGNANSTIVVMGLVVAGIGALLYALSTAPVEGVLETAESISMILGALSVSSIIISEIPTAGALKGVLAVGEVVAGMVAILAILGGLKQIPGFDWLINEGTSVLGQIGSALGGFVGGIVGGFLGGVSSEFPTIGQNLTDFMTNASGFFDGIAQIDADKLTAIESLAKGIDILMKSGFTSKLQSMFGGGTDVSELGTVMGYLGDGVKAFYEKTSDIDPEKLSNASSSAIAIADFAKALPNQGGALAWLVGDNTLSTFGAELEAFGPHIKKFGEDIQGFDDTYVEAAVNAANSVADFARIIPNRGGKLAEWVGDNSLSVFGEELELFGPHIKKFGEDIQGFDGTYVEAAVNAATLMAEFARILPNQGGKIALWFGDNRLSTFGNELAVFGPHLKAYADSVDGIKAQIVTVSANAAKALAEMSVVVSNTSVFGNMGQFGQDLETFGGHFKNYAQMVEDTSVESMRKAIIYLKDLVDAAKALSVFDPSQINAFSRHLQNLGTRGVDGFVSAFEDSRARTKQAGRYFVDGFVLGMEEKIASVSAIGARIGAAAQEGLRDRLDIHSPSGEGEKDGKYTVQGFIVGVKDGLRQVYEYGSRISQQYLGGVAEKLGIKVSDTNEVTSVFNSVLEQIGSTAVSSVATGIAKNTSAEEAAKNKAEAIAKEFEKPLALLETRLSTLDIDYQLYESGPTLDTSTSEHILNEIDHITSQLAIQTDKLALYEAQYKKTMAEFGADSEDTSKAYQTMVQAKIEINNLTKELTEAEASLKQLDLTKLDLANQTSDLERQLYQATHEIAEGSLDEAMLNLAAITEKLNLQAATVKMAEEEYQTTVANYGQDSVLAMQAYQSLLQGQIELTNLNKQLSEAQATAVAADKSAKQAQMDLFREYNAFLNANKDELLKFGFSMQEIQKYAAQVTGYNLKGMTQTMSNDAVNAVQNAMTSVQTAYANTATNTFGKLTSDFSQYGVAYGNALSTGLAQGAKTLPNTATTSVQAAEKAVGALNNEWVKVGEAMASSIAVGMKSKLQEVVDQAVSIVNASISAAKSAAASASASAAASMAGSKVPSVSGGGSGGGNSGKGDIFFYEHVGGDSDDNEDTVSAIDRVKDSIDKISSTLDKSGASSVLGALTGGVSTAIGNAVSKGIEAATSGTLADKIASSSSSKGSSGQPKPDADRIPISFIQNNYSPKAISPSETYRQTSNLLSSFSSAVSKK